MSFGTTPDRRIVCKMLSIVQHLSRAQRQSQLCMEPPSGSPPPAPSLADLGLAPDALAKGVPVAATWAGRPVLVTPLMTSNVNIDAEQLALEEETLMQLHTPLLEPLLGLCRAPLALVSPRPPPESMPLRACSALPVWTIVRIAHSVAMALAALHEFDLVHGSLTLDHVIVHDAREGGIASASLLGYGFGFVKHKSGTPALYARQEDVAAFGRLLKAMETMRRRQSLEDTAMDALDNLTSSALPARAICAKLAALLCAPSIESSTLPRGGLECTPFTAAVEALLSSLNMLAGAHTRPVLDARTVAFLRVHLCRSGRLGNDLVAAEDLAGLHHALVKVQSTGAEDPLRLLAHCGYFVGSMHSDRLSELFSAQPAAKMALQLVWTGRSAKLELVLVRRTNNVQNFSRFRIERGGGRKQRQATRHFELAGSGLPHEASLSALLKAAEAKLGPPLVSLHVALIDSVLTSAPGAVPPPASPTPAALPLAARAAEHGYVKCDRIEAAGVRVSRLSIRCRLRFHPSLLCHGSWSQQSHAPLSTDALRKEGLRISCAAGYPRGGTARAAWLGDCGELQ